MRAKKNYKEFKFFMLQKIFKKNVYPGWFRNKSGSAPLPEVTPATSCCSADRLSGLAVCR
jgi:hypothetical protein